MLVLSSIPKCHAYISRPIGPVRAICHDRHQFSDMLDRDSKRLRRNKHYHVHYQPHYRSTERGRGPKLDFESATIDVLLKLIFHCFDKLMSIISIIYILYAYKKNKQITNAIINVQFFHCVFIVCNFQELIQVYVIQTLFSALWLKIISAKKTIFFCYKHKQWRIVRLHCGDMS